MLIVVIFFADKLIFFPPTETYSDDLPGLQYLTNDSGEQVAIIYKPAEENMPTLLWSHGNAEDIGLLEHYLSLLHDQGYGILAYDYPGYGLSEGRPNEAACNRNIQAAWNYLTEELNIAEEMLYIIGQSVGSGPSVWLASNTELAGLILISPFKSINSVPFNINPFPYDRFPNIKRISKVSCPLLVIHGDRDTVINQSHGKALFKKHSGAKFFHSVTGFGHNDLLGYNDFNTIMFDFIKDTSE